MGSSGLIPHPFANLAEPGFPLPTLPACGGRVGRGVSSQIANAQDWQFLQSNPKWEIFDPSKGAS